MCYKVLLNFYLNNEEVLHRLPSHLNMGYTSIRQELNFCLQFHTNKGLTNNIFSSFFRLTLKRPQNTYSRVYPSQPIIRLSPYFYGLPRKRVQEFSIFCNKAVAYALYLNCSRICLYAQTPTNINTSTNTYVCIYSIYKKKYCYSLTSLEHSRAICNNICKLNCNMQIGQDELLSECQVINQSSKASTSDYSVELFAHTHIHICGCMCVCLCIW